VTSGAPRHCLITCTNSTDVHQCSKLTALTSANCLLPSPCFPPTDTDQECGELLPRTHAQEPQFVGSCLEKNRTM